MINFQVTPHFTIAELVSKSVLDQWGNRAVWFLDERLLKCLEFFRTRYGATYLNNWYWGGNLDSRVFRHYTDPEGGSWSQHRYCRAADPTFKSVTPDEVREDIQKYWRTVYSPLGITTIEARVRWTHFDLRYIPDQKELLIVYP